MSLIRRAPLLHRSVESLADSVASFALAAGIGQASGQRIPDAMTFLEWCDGLADAGLKVDGRPFDLSRRPALRAIYAAIPADRSEAYHQTWAIMKGAQTGLTVMTFLLMVFFALKYSPSKAGAFYPDRQLAGYVSSSRFLPVLRTVPDAYQALLDSSDGTEGNILTRRIGNSEILFLWTSGSIATESYPLDMIVADEVQGMLVDDVERIRERMSASDLRFFFACSTAKWPGADIDFLFKRGDQRRFHTFCACPDGVILDDVFPACIQFNEGQWAEAPSDYVYCCPACGSYIPDPQKGTWVRHAPDARSVSWHFPQTLSPTVSPREIFESFREAQDLQNFYNRKLGKPWTDPSQVPITLEICERQAEAGIRAGVVWKQQAKGTFLGIDQMGGFNVAIVLERLIDGRMAVIHAEFIYGENPFARCDEIMERFGVMHAVVETLPNVNDARAFANRHRGKVFLAGYADMRDDMMLWGDTTSRSDRRTAEEDRSRYTVSLNQYKTMQAALFRIRNGHCLFPDPTGLEQDIFDKAGRKRVAILREVWRHFTSVALVVEQDEETRKPRSKVVKIGEDPHAAFAFMLANVAWSRAYGMATILVPGADPDSQPERALAGRVEMNMPGLPKHVLRMIEDAPPGTCGRCLNFEEGRCVLRDLATGPREPACLLYEQKEGT